MNKREKLVMGLTLPTTINGTVLFILKLFNLINISTEIIVCTYFAPILIIFGLVALVLGLGLVLFMPTLICWILLWMVYDDKVII